MSLDGHIQFSSVHSRIGSSWEAGGGGRGRGNKRDDSAETFFKLFLKEAIESSSGMDKDVVSSSSISSADRGVAALQGALKDGFGEVVVACDMPETCKFPSLETVARRDSYGLTKELILLRTQSMVNIRQREIHQIASKKQKISITVHNTPYRFSFLKRTGGHVE